VGKAGTIFNRREVPRRREKRASVGMTTGTESGGVRVAGALCTGKRIQRGATLLEISWFGGVYNAGGIP